MITDNDVKKLKKVFVTKNDFNNFKKHVNKRFENTDKKIDKIAEDLTSVLTISSEISQKLDERVKEHDNILDDHERRLDKVEDKIFA